MITVADALGMSEALLAENGIAEPRREAVSLLLLALKRDKTFLYGHPEHALSDQEADLLNSYLMRRASREPLQYISGVQEFYGLEFAVTPNVLIPRPETEMVVERAVALLADSGAFCEVGTGSGCIAVSILVHVPNGTAVGLDVSPDALEVARRNAEKHGVLKRLQLLESDLFAALDDSRQFDVIVSNPPYVPARDLDGLQAEVREFEPQVALSGGPDGLSVIRRIIHDAPRSLRHGGHLLLEIGFDQSEKVVELFDPSAWHRPELFPDLQGIPRLVVGRLI